jgi:hypothetical protein
MDLISTLKDFTPLYQSIWNTYGDPWVGPKDYFFRKRPYRFFPLKGEVDKKKPKNIVFFLPFDLLHMNLKQTLNWENLEEVYNREVYNVLQDEISEANERTELIEKFGKIIQLYTLKLTEIAKYTNFEEKAIKIIAELWEKFYIYPLVSEQNHPSYHIYWNLVGDFAEKVYNKLNDPISKIFFNLCRFERYCSIYPNKFYTNLLIEFKVFGKEEIKQALELISKSDWRISHKFLLMLFSQFSVHIAPVFKEVFKATKEDLERTLQYQLKSRERWSSIKHTPPRDHSQTSFPFDGIFQNEALLDENILKNYTFFLNLLHHQIPDLNFIDSILKDYSGDNFDETLKKISQLPLSDISPLLDKIDEKSLIEINSFEKVKQNYLKLNNQEKLKEEKQNVFYYTIYSKVLQFFSITPMGETSEQQNHQYPQSVPLKVSEEIKDPEVKRAIELIDKREMDAKKLVEIISKKGINHETTKILTKCIPFFYIDSWDEAFSRKSPEIVREYQKDIFWFLVELLYDEKKYNEIYKKESDDTDYNYYGYDALLYYFRDDIENYIKRLIFDGIVHNNLLEWYSESPKNIPKSWIEENIDHVIINQVFIPNQINNIPETLRKRAARHAWKYIILPDLLNKVEQYFEGYRNTFPEAEDIYDEKNDSYNETYLGL